MDPEKQLIQYDTDLALFASKNTLRRKDFFEFPEVIQFRAASTDQFTKMQEALAANSNLMAVREENWRFTTFAHRMGYYLLPHFGRVEWVEVAEPSKRMNGQTAPELTGVKFFVDDISKVSATLRARHLQPEHLDGEISIPLRGHNQRIIFTDIDTSYIVEDQIKNRLAIPVTLN
jgi:hypothetical protein